MKRYIAPIILAISGLLGAHQAWATCTPQFGKGLNTADQCVASEACGKACGSDVHYCIKRVCADTGGNGLNFCGYTQDYNGCVLGGCGNAFSGCSNCT